LEFNSKNVVPSVECIEALITVNNQLGLSDRAAGVLQHIKTNFKDIEIKPLWLEKLLRWEDARTSYEAESEEYLEKFPDSTPAKHEKWLSTELGKLRCLHALGEYDQLEKCGLVLKEQIKASEENSLNAFNASASLEEVQRLGANAAWMLGKWDEMDDFLDHNVSSAASNFNGMFASTKSIELEKNISFYQAVQAIHNRDYEQASNLISETRISLSSSISSLLSESYSRAYKAMVTMQILAEMEEVIEYKIIAEKAAIDLEVLKSNNANDINLSFLKGSVNPRDKIASATTDLALKKSTLIRKWRGRLKWVPKEVDVYRQILVSLIIIFCIVFYFAK
jgi:FKBP12-rapamycin complex-associated protein